MKIVLFGATGMVGQGILRECLADSGVTEVVTISRSPLKPPAEPLPNSGKLREVQHADLFDYRELERQGVLDNADACYFPLGVSAVGMSEADYRRVTYGLTLAAANALAARNAQMTFIYVSGQGTNAGSRQMWARVKGETENALLQLPIHAAYMFRPGFIQPLNGIRSSTRWYQMLYDLTAPITPLMVRRLPKYATTTSRIGQAMLNVTRNGWPDRVLESAAINRACCETPAQ